MKYRIWLLKLRLRAILGLIPPRIFITHTDLDGVVSYVILRKRFGEGLLIFSTPRKIHQVINSLSHARGRELYVTDIGINESNKEEIERGLNKMVSKGWKVTWIDHHKWPEIRVPGANFIIKPAPSAAQLVFDAFDGDDILPKLVELANDADTATYSMEESRILATVCRGTRWLKKVAKNLLEGKIVTPEIEERAKELMERDEKKIEEALSRVKFFKTSSGREFAVIDFRPRGGPGSQASKKLVERRPVDFVLVLYNCVRFSLYRGVGDQDLSLACRKFNGGGHPYACGGRINLSWLERLLCLLGLINGPSHKLIEFLVSNY